MLEEDLSISFERADVHVQKTNEAYNFEVCSLRSDQHKFTLVFTRGLSSTGQEVPEQFSELEHIELLFCLPEYFSLSTTPWPINWIEKIACIPQKNSTWLGIGDTIPAGKPPSEIADNFKANHFIVMQTNWMNQFIKAETKIKYLALIPIFQEELDFKLRNSHTVLFKKLNQKNVTEQIDTYRTSVCRKRFMGMI